MKVKIGPYISWIGPYQIAEKLFFWVKKYDDQFVYTKAYNRVHDFGKWLAEDKNGNDSYLARICQWVQNKKTKQVTIHIDPWDSWNAHNTASLILYPLFKQLRETNHGYFLVDDEDVPEELRSHFATEPGNEENGRIDSSAIKRYDWVMGEILFALENDNTDWENRFYHNFPDGKEHQADLGGSLKFMSNIDFSKTDYVGMEKFNKRIDNGFVLMGKYWRHMWD